MGGSKKKGDGTNDADDGATRLASLECAAACATCVAAGAASVRAARLRVADDAPGSAAIAPAASSKNIRSA
jgi:hypothetical protein